MSEGRLLIVDDTPGVCELIRNVAEDMGYQVRTAMRREEFESAFVELAPTFITLDLQLPGGDGIEIIRYLAEQECSASIAVISGFDTKVVGTAMRLGQERGLNMVGSLRKPFAVTDLEVLLDSAPRPAFSPTDTDLREALEQGRVVPYYQPKAVVSGSGPCPLCAAEALARWEHPSHGVILPGVFIPLAEAAGLIEDLTWSIVGQTAAQLVAWRRNGLNIRASVNIAPCLLTDLEYPDKLVRVVAERGAEPDWIVLEITEAGAMQDPERAMDILTRLRLKGFNLSCDDFGTGYSSLVQLYRMPFGELKIDRSFVFDAIAHEEARTIIHASIELGHNLGLTVCAEGVENEAVFDYLRYQGCDSIQGFYLGRAVSAAEFPALVGQAEDLLAARSAARQA